MGLKPPKIMKRILVYTVFACFCALISCDDNVTSDQEIVNNIESQNEAIDLMAIAFSKAMTNTEFRELIRIETNKQFDFDYDVLYRFIEGKSIASDGGVQKSVSDFLLQQIENEIKASNLTHDYLRTISSHIPTLNICVPIQYIDWNPAEYVPKVASFPVEFDEKTHDRVKCFASNGELTWVTKAEQDWELPIVTIGLSERVDENGMITVNSYDIVIDPELRYLTAEEAYANASSMLKSGKAIEYESIVKVVDFSDPGVIQMMKEKHGDIVYSDEQRIIVNEADDLSAKKSANSVNQLAKPPMVEIYPYTTAKSIFLNWGDVGADKYHIYRKVNGGSLQHRATVNWIEGTTYIDQWLTSGYEYLYQIYGEKNGENSYWSDAVHAEATWRKSKGYERLWSLYLNSDCWSDISWGRSKCEIMMRVVRYDVSNTSLILEPVGTGGASKRNQRNKTYLYKTRLFRWDFSKHAWNYLIYFYEQDGGNPVEVNLGAKAFVGYKAGDDGTPGTAGAHLELNASVKFTIGKKDDEMGVIEINHDEPLGFRYTIPVPRGRAHCYINQE